MKNKEWEKMIGGEIYDATDPEILDWLNRTKDAVWEYNRIRPTDLEAREQALI